jgi:hypothetical protein
MPEHPIAIIRSTEDLRQLFRLRVAHFNISLETLDAIAGLPTRYSAKLLSHDPTRHFGKISFEALLGTLAVQLVALEDAEALVRVQRRLMAAPLQRIDTKGWRAELKRENEPEVIEAAAQ